MNVPRFWVPRGALPLDQVHLRLVEPFLINLNPVQGKIFELLANQQMLWLFSSRLIDQQNSMKNTKNIFQYYKLGSIF